MRGGAFLVAPDVGSSPRKTAGRVLVGEFFPGAFSRSARLPRIPIPGGRRGASRLRDVLRSQ